MSETLTTKPSLFAKLALIAGAIEGAATDGFNPQLKYKYPTPATIFRAVKPHMAAHRVAIIPTLEGVERVESGRTSSGQAKYVTTVTMTYTVADGDSGEVLTIRWQGEGEDWSDKGIAKAQTIATRTFLTHLFQIPAGIEDDDPDSAAAPVAPEPPRARVVPAPRITKPSPQPTDERTTAINHMREAAKECKVIGIEIDMPTATDVAAMSLEAIRGITEAWEDKARQYNAL